MAASDDSGDWRSGWHARMVVAADERRRIACCGALDDVDQRGAALEAALAILLLKRSSDRAGP